MENTVELIGYYGSDELHACSAWTSTNRDITPEKRERIPKLLNMLSEAGHHTPFEKSALHFLVNSDIASHIHKLKHRIGTSINGESARYKELKEDKFYIPDDWKNIKATRNVSIATIFGDQWINGCEWDKILKEYNNLGNILYHECVKDLEPVLGRKRAKESSRYFKTYSSQIQCDIMFNFRSFYHFVNLRHKKDAQKEIFDIADKMITLVKNIEGNPFKFTLEAFKL